jgi:hypothetical protein
VKNEAFCGYTIEDHHGFDVLIAEAEKALVDYIYFKTLRNKELDIEALRLDKNKMSKLNQKKLDAYSRIYGINLKGVLDDHL